MRSIHTLEVFMFYVAFYVILRQRKVVEKNKQDKRCSSLVLHKEFNCLFYCVEDEFLRKGAAL